jgi:cell division septal protein FtsQ
MFKKHKKSNRFVSQPRQTILPSTNLAANKSFRHTKHAGHKRKPIFWLLISLIILIIAFIWITFFTNIFTIKRIDISQTKYIPTDLIEKLVWEQANHKAWLVLPENKIFFFARQKLVDTLNNNFQLQALHITKAFPDTLKINFVEKEFSVIWNEAGQFHYINNEGDIILTQTAPQEGQIVIYNQGSALLQGKKIKVDPKIIKFINDLNDRVNAKQAVKAKEFVVDDDVTTVKMKAERGPLIFFNAQLDIDKQVTKLEALIKELGDTYDQENYIDLRFGDRIFYQ